MKAARDEREEAARDEREEAACGVAVVRSAADATAPEEHDSAKAETADAPNVTADRAPSDDASGERHSEGDSACLAALEGERPEAAESGREMVERRVCARGDPAEA